VRNDVNYGVSDAVARKQCELGQRSNAPRNIDFASVPIAIYAICGNCVARDKT
jgi:hypothetical protein